MCSLAQVHANSRRFSDDIGRGAPAGSLPEVATSRTAIAAMAHAAAAAAGLPDPAAAEEDDEPLSPMEIDDSLGDGPALALAAAAAAAAIAEAEADGGGPVVDAARDSLSPGSTAAAAAAGEAEAGAAEGTAAAADGKPTAAAAAALAATAPGAAAKAAGGSSLDGALLGQVLTALQRQMQKLIQLDERRSVDIVRLNAKVSRKSGPMVVVVVVVMLW